jgi:UDP-N-acetyl-D-glucosamine dehydrogenase
MENKKVCVIGLGYVGLPLACLSSKYFQTVGFDIDVEKISKINNGFCPINDDYTKKLFSECDLKVSNDVNSVSMSDIVVVCVPTPIDENYFPNLGPLKSASRLVRDNLRDGQLIIIESTIYPGTTQEVIIPILEESGKRAGVDFFVAYCPERIDPGNDKWNLQNIARVLGGVNNESLEMAYGFYSKIIDAQIKKLKSLKSAEAVKILENTFRDVNIAFINEMAKSFDVLGIDLKEVIDGAKTKPFGFMPFYPGPGVGGHCIPVDPYYLIERAKKEGFNHRFLDLARKINLSMPQYVVKLVQNGLNDLGRCVRGVSVGVLGLAYKAGIEDVRESPALKVCSGLRKLGSDLKIYDPYVLSLSNCRGVDELLDSSEVVVVLTDHKEFLEVDYNLFKLKGVKLIVDAKNCLDGVKIVELGIRYVGIGRGK